jgi:hypothetical protein
MAIINMRASGRRGSAPRFPTFQRGYRGSRTTRTIQKACIL